MQYTNYINYLHVAEKNTRLKILGEMCKLLNKLYLLRQKA
jgi:hypothetical protein